MIKEKMKYTTFTEFCNKAIYLRELYAIKSDTPFLVLKAYRDYVYSHNFGNYTMMLNNKCWEWLLSKPYEPMEVNDLFSILGNIKKNI